MITLTRAHAEAARVALIHRAADLRRGVRRADAEAMRAIADVCQAAAEDIERQLVEGSR